MKARGEAVEFGESGGEASAVGVGKAALGLMESESFREDAKEAAMAGIEALPEAALFAAIAAKPVFGRGGGAAGCWLGGRRNGVEGAADHGVGKWKRENGN